MKYNLLTVHAVPVLNLNLRIADSCIAYQYAVYHGIVNDRLGLEMALRKAHTCKLLINAPSAAK